MVRAFLSFLLMFPLYVYRYGISPLLGGGKCRFFPCCSQYALEAIKIHGPWKGLGLALRRLGKCHPYAKAPPWDPVPPKGLWILAVMFSTQTLGAIPYEELVNGFPEIHHQPPAVIAMEQPPPPPLIRLPHQPRDDFYEKTYFYEETCKRGALVVCTLATLAGCVSCLVCGR